MRMLVLGHSDSSGNQLPAAERHLAWPWLVAAEMPALIGGEPVELIHRVLFPVATAQYAQFEGYLEEFDPDIVLLATSHFAFTAFTVKSKVRKRWGRRGLGLARRTEEIFDRIARPGRFGTRANRLGRAVAGRLVGAAPLSTYDQVVASYRAILARLARAEDVAVVVMGGAHYSLTIPSPAIQQVIDRFKGEMAATAAQYRFPWIDTSIGMDRPDIERFRLPGDFHRNALGHREAADRYLPVVVDAVLRRDPTA